jgi:endoglucanase
LKPVPPCLEPNTLSETLSLTDVEDCARLAAAYCRRVTPETDFTPVL